MRTSSQYTSDRVENETKNIVFDKEIHKERYIPPEEWQNTFDDIKLK